MQLTLDQIAANWFVRPGDIVLDIGTYRGDTAEMYLARGASLVHGFEPRAAPREGLPPALLNNPRFRLWPYALGDRNGPADLHVPGRNPGGATLDRRFFESTRGPDGVDDRVETVEVRRLDDLGLPPAQFWKVDAEGAELEILKGAAGTLKVSPPAAIQVEIFLHDRDRYAETLNFIGDRFRHFWSIGLGESGKLIVYDVDSSTVSSRHFHRDLARTGTPRYFASDRSLQDWVRPAGTM